MLKAHFKSAPWGPANYGNLQPIHLSQWLGEEERCQSLHVRGLPPTQLKDKGEYLSISLHWGVTGCTVRGLQVFAMDVTSGYNQVPVTERNKSKTSFCTSFGLFEWSWMPFGLSNAPPHSSNSWISYLLTSSVCRYCCTWHCDGIVVFSSTVMQHLERLEGILIWLEHENFKVKLGKCAFFQQEVSYLSYIISGQGVLTVLH